MTVNNNLQEEKKTPEGKAERHVINGRVGVGAGTPIFFVKSSNC